MIEYRSALPLRTQPVREADFFTIPDMVIDGDDVNVRVSYESIDDWNRIIPLMPADVCAVLRDSYPEDVEINFDFIGHIADITLNTVNSENFKSSFVAETGSRKSLDQSTVGVMPGVGGFGRPWLRSMVEFAVAAGLADFRFGAGLTNGGYVWARAGAHLDFEISESRKVALTSRQLIGRAEALKDVIPDRDYQRARALSRLVAKDDFAKLARMDVPVPLVDRDMLKKSLLKFYEINSSVDGPEYTTNHEISFMARAFRHAAEEGNDATLAQLLLANVSWNAVIDFADARQMETVGNYVGGWNTIAPFEIETPRVAMR